MGFSKIYPSENVVLDVDFIDQSTGEIVWHRRLQAVANNRDTYSKRVSDIVDSLVRSSSVGNYSLLVSVARPVQQVLDIFDSFGQVPKNCPF